VLVSLAAVAVLVLLQASAASATFHLMMVREVYPGSAASPGAEYVELQMWASGQNHVAGHVLRTYDATGALTGTSTFPTSVAGSANQSTLLLATPQAEADFGVAADAPLSPGGQLSPAGGAVCWETIDCVAWGDFSGPLPSPAGSPAAAAGVPDGMAIRRTVSRGCATALDPADDNDDSAADFSPASPAPRPNSVPPSEQLCTTSPGAGGGGGGSGSPPGQGGTPQTVLRRKPPRRGADRTPTFAFAADEPGARFQCKLDGRPFRACRSPFTTKRLGLGAHAFRVRAVDSAGRLDRTPALWRFRVVAHG
jgi:hypothetical protein